MPEPEKLSKVPPETATSSSVKSVEASLSVNVTVGVSEALTVALGPVTSMAGAVVSTLAVDKV